MRFFLGCIGLLVAAVCPAAPFDFVIRGARVADGTGNPARFADIGIIGDRVSAIGKVHGEAQRVIDAKGLIVAPGFIDVHTHAEEVMELPLAENFLRMGVTTLVLGNCGSSVLDVGQFFGRLDKSNVAVNVATLVGHGTVRRKAMDGNFDREPTEQELNEMRELVRKGMDDGAVGISTGLIYLPGTFAKTDEIIELAKIASEFGGIYASHMRSESGEIVSALEELFRIAREGRLRAEISHIKLSGNASWGKADKILALIEQARAEGLDITQDQYMYTASSTGIAQLIPEKYREGGKYIERLNDPKQKRAMIAEMHDIRKKSARKDYTYAVISDYGHDATYNGLTIPEAAKKRFGSNSLKNQIEMILEIQKNGGASGVFHGIHENDLQKFLNHPNTMFASDSGMRRYKEGVPHPRGYGNSARVLARYVRELNLLRLEDAVRRMTSLPATTFGLKGRGALQEGAPADLVIFDPQKVQDNATFKDPHHYATGFKLVMVNGIPVIEDDQHTGAKPGRPLRLNR